jgi:sensor histidine kinase YesM
MEFIKELSELRLNAVQSVMNPHFIFNALNSIQYHIAKNDKKDALLYLSTFSKLLRGIMSHASADKITLSDELALLTHYLELELLRFEDKFSFKIEISSDLKTDVALPPFVVQPYLEQAILNSLSNNQKKGMVEVSFSQEGSYLVVEIKDNGVQQGQSSVGETLKSTFHSSFIEKRQKTNEAYNIIENTVIDAHSSTCVTLRINIQQNLSSAI